MFWFWFSVYLQLKWVRSSVINFITKSFVNSIMLKKMDVNELVPHLGFFVVVNKDMKVCDHFFGPVQKPNIKSVTWLDNIFSTFRHCINKLHTKKEIEFCCSTMTLKMCPWLLGWNNAIIHKPHLDWHKKTRTQIEFQYGQDNNTQ